MEATDSSTHILPTEQSRGKRTVLYEQFLQIPREDSQWTAQVTCPTITKSISQARSLLCSGAREKFCPIYISGTEGRGKCSPMESRDGGTSLVVQWLRLPASNAGGEGSIPGGGTKIPRAAWCSQKKKKENRSGREW